MRNVTLLQGRKNIDPARHKQTPETIVHGSGWVITLLTYQWPDSANIFSFIRLNHYITEKKASAARRNESA